MSRIFVRFLLILTMAVTAFAGIAMAERPPAPREPSAGIMVLPGSDQVLRIQRALAEEGFYRGAINGRFDSTTEKAIRAFQKRERLPVDGRVSDELLARLETRGKVERLLLNLEEARQRETAAARQALLSQPETRHLLDDDKVEKHAGPNDPGNCLDAPTAQCLLAHAVRDAALEPKVERRDWALGEILTAQAKVGLVGDALATVKKIRDVRLVLVALGSIAKAQAAAGRFDEARAAAAIIPDVEKRVDALLETAARQVAAGVADGALETLEQTIPDIESLSDILERVAASCRASVILHQAGQVGRAGQTLQAAYDLARAPGLNGHRAAALRHVASAFAAVGHTREAMDVLQDVRASAERTPILVAAAAAQAGKGDPEAALETAHSIEGLRYRAVVLAGIATEQSKQGAQEGAEETIRRALLASSAIRLPYAKSYAVGRVAEALIEMSAFDRAATIARDIGDDRLKAEILWRVSLGMAREGDASGAARVEKSAIQATGDIIGGMNRSWLYADLTLRLMRAGKSAASRRLLDLGLAEAGKIQSPWGRGRALARLADVLSDLN
ncbi:MAG: peptidoglycan-binding protein [Rhodospirillales bacterium]|nr:peptidoglycan-binding protein [Rhodospirillales bacterium]